MLVNLTDVFTNEGQVQELEVPYDADAFTNHFGTFQIREKSPVALRLSNIGRSKALKTIRSFGIFILQVQRNF